MLELDVPDSLVCRSFPHGGMLMLDQASGRWHALNPTASTLWMHWQRGVSFENSVTTLVDRYPQVAPDRIHDDAEQLLDELVARGLIRVRVHPAGGAVTMADAARPPRLRSTTWRRRMLPAVALCCVIVAVVGSRLPFRTIHWTLRNVRKAWCRGPVSFERACSIVGAVHRVASWYPGRLACLEQSLAAVVLATLVRQQLVWCLGAATDPYRFHAWVEADGKAVPDPYEPEAAAPDYRRVVAV